MAQWAKAPDAKPGSLSLISSMVERINSGKLSSDLHLQDIHIHTQAGKQGHTKSIPKSLNILKEWLHLPG